MLLTGRYGFKSAFRRLLIPRQFCRDPNNPCRIKTGGLASDLLNSGLTLYLSKDNFTAAPGTLDKDLLQPWMLRMGLNKDEKRRFIFTGRCSTIVAAFCCRICFDLSRVRREFTVSPADWECYHSCIQYGLTQSTDCYRPNPGSEIPLESPRLQGALGKD